MKKRFTLGLSIVALAFSLAACGSSSKEAAEESAPMEWAAEEEAVEGLMDSYYSEEYKATNTETGSAEAPELDESATSDRKLIKTVDLSVETKEYDKLMVSLENQIDEMGGYIESLGAYNRSYYDSYNHHRSANITARIPADKLDGFLKQIGEEANIVDRNESVEDVTLQYVDLDSHARMLEEEQDRLLVFLSEAETIEDIIAIESRLSEVKYQLESMKSQLRTFDNKVQYSTVHIYIDEVVELTPVVELTAGQRIAEGFKDSIEDIAEGFKEFGIEFIIHIPYIIVWAVVIVILVFVVLKIIKMADKWNAHIMKKAPKEGKHGNINRSVYVRKPGTPAEDGKHEDKTE